MLRLFLRFEIEKIGKYFTTKTLAKIITSLLFVFVFLFVGSIIYLFFLSGFRYIRLEAVEDIRQALTLFLYEIFLLVLSLVIIFSSAISGIFSLFRGGYNTWFMATPLYTVLPKIVFIKSLTASTLPSLILFLPAILAFTKVHNLGGVSLFFIMVSITLLTAMVSALTLVAVVLIGYLYYVLAIQYKKIRFTFKGLLVLLGACTSLVGVVLLRELSKIDLITIFKADEASDVLNVSTISNHFIFLPTHPFAMQILNWQNAYTKNAILYFLVLLALSLISVLFWWKISPLFYPLWQKLQEGTFLSYANQKDSSLKIFTYEFTGNILSVLSKKELLISTRNFKGILWFLFLFLIWLMQIITNTVLGNTIQKDQTDVSHKIAMFQAIQFIIATYFISAFTLRFVFPSFSTEKKTNWILASAPLNFKKIFLGKYLFYISFFTILGLLMSYINIQVLQLSFSYAISTILLFTATTVVIVTSGLVSGALYPNTETDDPEAITTSMPGLFFTAFSLLYGALSATTLYTSITQKNLSFVTIFIVVSLIFTSILLLRIQKQKPSKAF